MNNRVSTNLDIDYLQDGRCVLVFSDRNADMTKKVFVSSALWRKILGYPSNGHHDGSLLPEHFYTDG
jgi:hypothetical protein